MNDATGTANTRDGRAAALLAHYERAGYARAEPALLQPAEPEIMRAAKKGVVAKNAASRKVSRLSHRIAKLG